MDEQIKEKFIQYLENEIHNYVIPINKFAKENNIEDVDTLFDYMETIEVKR